MRLQPSRYRSVPCAADMQLGTIAACVLGIRMLEWKHKQFAPIGCILGRSSVATKTQTSLQRTKLRALSQASAAPYMMAVAMTADDLRA
jgi:hypothetical protein